MLTHQKVVVSVGETNIGRALGPSPVLWWINVQIVVVVSFLERIIDSDEC